MTKDKKEIGKRIRQIRNSLGENQTEFGKRFGALASSVSAYEKGETSPSFEMIATIAKLGKMSIDDLLTGGRQDAPPYPDMYDIIKGEEEAEGIVPIDPDSGPDWNPAKIEHVFEKLFASADYLKNKLGNGQISALLEGIPTTVSENDRRLLSAFRKLDMNRKKRLIEEAEDMVLAQGNDGKE
jgi:transcriptional regulator with XRE-family HTH domain